jgi:hypothetical protein
VMEKKVVMIGRDIEAVVRLLKHYQNCQKLFLPASEFLFCFLVVCC